MRPTHVQPDSPTRLLEEQLGNMMLEATACLRTGDTVGAAAVLERVVTLCETALREGVQLAAPSALLELHKTCLEAMKHAQLALAEDMTKANQADAAKRAYR